MKTQVHTTQRKRTKANNQQKLNKNPMPKKLMVMK
jgi:hypothetical protein